MEGKVIKIITSTLYNRFDIYREDLSNGMYLFKVIQGNEEIANGKVIVQ